MLHKSYLLVPLLLVLLAACSQAPAPEADAPALEPLTFGSSGYDAAKGLAKHGSGVFAAGDTGGNLHGTQKGNGDVFIRKYDTSGAVLWGRQFGTPQYESAEGVASDGSNAYVVGVTYGSLAGSRGNSDLFLRKYTSSGSVAWTRQFGTSNYDYAGDVAVYGSSIYVVGFTPGTLSGGGGSKGSYDAFIIKYNSSGSVVWTRQFGTSAEDLAYDVKVDGSGNVYVAGYTYGALSGTNGGGSDVFLRKYSPSGGVQWTRQRHYSDYDTGMAVAVSGSNVYLVGGWWYLNNYEDPDVRVVKYTTAGSLVWDYGYGPSGYDYVYDASTDSNGNLYFAGETHTSFGGTHQGNGDGYVIKLNSSGSYLWKKQLGTSEYDNTNAVLALTTSQVYAAGTTYGTLGSSNSGSADAYLRRFNGSNGSTVWTDQ